MYPKLASNSCQSSCLSLPISKIIGMCTMSVTKHVLKMISYPSLSVIQTTGTRFSPSMPNSCCKVSRFRSKVSTLPMLNQTNVYKNRKRNILRIKNKQNSEFSKAFSPLRIFQSWALVVHSFNSSTGQHGLQRSSKTSRATYRDPVFKKNHKH